jgi:hypothetical protein
MILYLIRSEDQLMEQIDFNILYRWFAGMEAARAGARGLAVPTGGRGTKPAAAGQADPDSGAGLSGDTCLCRRKQRLSETKKQQLTPSSAAKTMAHEETDENPPLFQQAVKSCPVTKPIANSDQGDLDAFALPRKPANRNRFDICLILFRGSLSAF